MPRGVAKEKSPRAPIPEEGERSLNTHSKRLCAWIVAVVLTLAIALSLARAAEDEPAAATSGETSAEPAAEPAQEVPKSREEKIREHRERIRTIIQERREQQAKDGDSKPGPPPAAAPPAAVEGATEAPVVDKEQDVPAPPGAPGDAAPSGSDVKVNNCMLYMKPLDTLAVDGERFVTRVVLDNPSGQTLDKLSIALQYDPRILSCVRVFDDQFRPYVVPSPTFEDRPTQGLLYYEAVLKQPRALQKLTVLTIIWNAVRTSPYTEIEFAFADEGPTTSITAGGNDILGMTSDPYDGVINTSVLVKKKDTPAQTDLMNVKRKDVIDFFTGTDNPPGAIGLALGEPEKPARVGDKFDIPIELLNPNALALDMLSVYISFNPEELEVLDWDKGNWIRRGVNIYDGDRHDEYPFDYLVRNEAMNATGTIEYRVGLQRPRGLPSGRIATIRFRALKPAVDTTVKFIVRKEGEKRTTNVTLNGNDILDLNAPGSVRAVRFPIYP